MFLSVVIPAYNEAPNIPRITRELENNIREIAGISGYEIIICDDHSTDGTFEAVKKLNKPEIKSIRLSRRSGSHAAIRAGLTVARGDAVLCISADGQDDPSVLPKMIEKIRQGKNIVWGVRKSRNEPFLNKQFALLFYKLLSMFVANENRIDLANADFYLLDRKVVNAINMCPERNTSLFGLIAWIGFDQDEVIYERRERMSGQSKWSFNSKLRLALDWIMAFSGLPLKLISLMGIGFAGLGFAYAVFIIIYTLLGYATPGWAETAVLILVIGGIQMTMIGVIGEYLWRTLDESRSRPLFFIEKTTDEKDK
jgi:glycosyltransferase involved in cell wall biosynthesis